MKSEKIVTDFILQNILWQHLKVPSYIKSLDDTEGPMEEVINSVSVLVNINKMDSLQKISALKVARTEQNPNRLLVNGKELPKQIKCLVQDFLDQDNCF